MDTIVFDKDIKVLYVTAKSFPDGIAEAFSTLHSAFPESQNRRAFGISRPEHGKGIVYRAATEELTDGEAEKLKFDRLVLPKGKYIAIIVDNFREDITSIGRSFEQLLKDPGIDPQGYCVELYATDKEAVTCMVRLDQ